MTLWQDEKSSLRSSKRPKRECLARLAIHSKPLNSRIEVFKRDLKELRTTFGELKSKASEFDSQNTRSELLLGRRQPNSSAENPYSNSPSPAPQQLSRQQGALNERDFINRTDSQLDEYIQRGRDVLDNLLEQRGFLKDAQRKVLDSANTLGLSRQTIRFVERRTTQDKWIFYGGATTVFVCFWLIWRYLG